MYSSSISAKKAKVVDVDLSAFVPGWFWTPDRRYQVVAAAAGLVCISNNSATLWTDRHCVLNPLTRTCTGLPPVPFPPHRCLLLTPCAVTICTNDDHSCRGYKVATYDFAGTSSGGGGGLAVVAAQGSAEIVRSHALALCGGTIYRCSGGARTFSELGESGTHRRPVYILAPGEEEEVAALDAPPVAPLRRRTLCEYGLGVVAHRGEIFYVAHVLWWDGRPRSPCRPPVVCGVWRLQQPGDRGAGESAGDVDVDVQQQKHEWVEVARLEVEEVKRLTALRYASAGHGGIGHPHHRLDFDNCDFNLFRPYGLRELLCCSLVRVRCHTQVDGDGSECRRLLVLPGFNLDTGHWELVHELQHPAEDGPVFMPAALDLRPDLYVSPAPAELP